MNARQRRKLRRKWQVEHGAGPLGLDAIARLCESVDRDRRKSARIATLMQRRGVCLKCDPDPCTCAAENAAIQALEECGHTSHCACRQVWGDGECECR